MFLLLPQSEQRNISAVQQAIIMQLFSTRFMQLSLLAMTSNLLASNHALDMLSTLSMAYQQSGHDNDFLYAALRLPDLDSQCTAGSQH